MTDHSLAAALNRYCHCINVDTDVLQQSLRTRLGASGAWSSLRETHPHLLADAPVFISRDHIEQMKALVDAIERVVALPAYKNRVLAWAPEIARHDAGTQGVFFGYDFHLTNAGPRLIEVNTNAGGALLLLHVASAQQACCPEVENFVIGRADAPDLEQAFVDMFRNEMRLQFPGRELRRIAIVDEKPGEQYLAPEFTLFRQMFEQHGIDAIVAGPEELAATDEQLLADDKPVDLVYNRLTDFYLRSPACAALRHAVLTGAAVVTPGPHSHALYANKRNLTLLSDASRLEALGVDAQTISAIVAGIPKTVELRDDNADELWAARKRLYFKPEQGFGSRGTYKGAKLTRKTWESILGAGYVAQELVPPSERLVLLDGEERSLKLDVRCYTYQGKIQLLGARLYRGQTTNFRTTGGGLAAVFMAPGLA